MPPPPDFAAETDLYPPVKRFLEARGLVPKGEVRGCDVVAIAPDAPPDAPPVVVELKRAITLAAVMQAVDRFAISDAVYLAAPAPRGGDARRALSPTHAGLRRLCRRLGLGLLAVHPPSRRGGASGAWAEAVLEPEPYRVPRRNKARAAGVLREHARREGDPNAGGARGGVRLVTAYRQEAARCARALAERGGGPLSVAAVRAAADAPGAGRILYRNVYGWFEPRGRDLYGLTEHGARELRAMDEAAAPPPGARKPDGPAQASPGPVEARSPAPDAAAEPGPARRRGATRNARPTPSADAVVTPRAPGPAAGPKRTPAAAAAGRGWAAAPARRASRPRAGASAAAPS